MTIRLLLTPSQAESLYKAVFVSPACEESYERAMDLLYVMSELDHQGVKQPERSPDNNPVTR